MQFFWKHLHNNKGDENVSKLIWIVIAFVIGALLLSTMSVAFRTEGAIGGWLSSSLEEWFGEADGRDGSVGGGAGGSGGSLPGGGGGDTDGKDEQVNEINGAVLKYDGENHVAEEPNASHTSLFEHSIDDVFTTTLYLTSNGATANSENLIYEFSTMTQRDLISNTKAVDAIVSQNIIVLQYKSGAFAYVGLDKNEKLIIVSSDETVLNNADVIFSATKCTGTNTDIALFEVETKTENIINYYEEISNSVFNSQPIPNYSKIPATLKYFDGAEENVMFEKYSFKEGMKIYTYLPASVKNGSGYNAETDKGLMFAIDAKVNSNGEFEYSEGNNVLYISPDDETCYEIEAENITGINIFGVEISNISLLSYAQEFKGTLPSGMDIPVKINYKNGNTEQKTAIYAGEEEGVELWGLDVGFGLDYPLIIIGNAGKVLMYDEKDDYTYWGLDYKPGSCLLSDSTDGDGASLWPTIKSIEINGIIVPLELGQTHKNITTTIDKSSIPADTDIDVEIGMIDGTSSIYTFKYDGKTNDINRWKCYLNKYIYLEFAYNAKIENVGYGQGTLVASNGTSVFGLADAGNASNEITSFYKNIEYIKVLGATKTFCITTSYLNQEEYSGGDYTHNFDVPRNANKLILTFSNSQNIEIDFKESKPYETNEKILEHIYENINDSITVILNPYSTIYGGDIKIEMRNNKYDISELQKIIAITNDDSYSFVMYDAKNMVSTHVAKMGDQSFIKFNCDYSETLIETKNNEKMEVYQSNTVAQDSYNYSPMTHCNDTLKRAILANSVIDISDYAFRKCENLVSVFIPNSVTSIANTAFEGCTSLTTIYGVAGSYAETFANANGYNFIAI